jgi:formylglycine-generating enzyme required for sulfatase activity
MRIRPILPPLVALALLAPLLVPSPARTQQRGLGVAQTPPAGTGRYYALIIGNDDYASLPKLKTAAADAREVERVLRESYGFQTKLLLNATRSQIVAALSSYRRELNAEASLLVYYAGHGYNDRDADKAYWLPVDATLDDVSNWIIADEITTAVRVIPARHVLVISDSCYSGTLTRGLTTLSPRPSEREQFLKKMSAGHSRTLMASGGDEPVADGGGSGHSVFAVALLRGLRQMDKPQFTAAELFSSYIIEPVAGRADQTPVYDPLRNSGHESGDFIFTRVKTDANSVELTTTTPPPLTVDPAQQELAFWNSIQNSTDAEDFKDYLARYPNGLYAGIARRRIASLSTAAKPMPTSTPSDAVGNVASAKRPSARPQQMTSGVGMEFIWIPPGSFIMGSENGGSDEKPVHRVTIKEGFYMGKYEVTQAQWQAVMGNNPSHFKGDNLPVESVSWNDAIAFIERLNAQNDAYIYRLPTEAEWEYACRAGTRGDYAGTLDVIAWYGNNAGGHYIDAEEIWRTDQSNLFKRLNDNGNQTHPVGTKQPNGFGLYDMHGNVWEWCQDWYHDSYNGAPADGSAWLSAGEQKYRVLRGGSWGDIAIGVRSAVRGWVAPGSRPFDGFRVVAVARR